jgi:hypothetical protein
MHGGIILPTGSGTQDVGYKASLLALPELYNSFHNATTIRLGLSSLFSDGDTFAQIDVGVDWNIQSDTPLDTGLHLNAGLGLRAGPLALTFESETWRSSISAPGRGNVQCTRGVAAHRGRRRRPTWQW